MLNTFVIVKKLKARVEYNNDNNLFKKSTKSNKILLKSKKFYMLIQASSNNIL